MPNKKEKTLEQRILVLESQNQELQNLLKVLKADNNNTDEVLCWLKNPGLLSVPNAADLIGNVTIGGKNYSSISARTLHRVLDEGLLKHTMIKNKRMISLNDLFNYIKDSTIYKIDESKMLRHGIKSHYSETNYHS